MAVLELTTMTGCPLKCTFCPQDPLKAAYGKTAAKYMSLETLITVLDKLPQHVRIDFSGMAEPWANPLATRMLETVLERGRQVAIYTTLYGMELEDSRKLTEVLLPRHERQIDIVCLHLPDANRNMRGFKPSREYKNVLRNFVRMIHRGDFPATKVSAMTMDRSGRLHPELTEILPNPGAWNGHSRAGSLGETQIASSGAFPPPRNERPVVCASTPFYDHNVLLPNGDVLLCAMDYGMKHVIGNLLQSGYWELFGSAELARVRSENQKPGFSKCSICKQCDNVLAVSRTEMGQWNLPSGIEAAASRDASRTKASV